MKEKFKKCVFCRVNVEESGVYVRKNGKFICMPCSIELLEPIYEMDYTGLPHIAFKHLLTTKFNRKRRKSIKDYKKILDTLMHKYNFKCCNCSTDSDLTIDHIIPISKGGNNNYENLQILCRICNSKKGTKVIRYA